MSVSRAKLVSALPPQIGRSLPRIEDERALRGKACHVDDLKLPGLLHAAFARSTAARASLRHIDTQVAGRQPGVRAVFTGSMLGNLPALTMNSVVQGLRQFERALLAVDRVHAVGEPIALVVAETAEVAHEAAELIEVQYDFEEPVVDVAAALASPPLIHGWPNNEVFAHRSVHGDCDGAFGGKASLYPEDVLVAWASMKLARPVKWIATRNEEFTSASHGRGAAASAEAALDSAGHFLAVRASLIFPVGHWGTYSAAVPAWNAARILPGPYAVPAVDICARGVVTNSA